MLVVEGASPWQHGSPQFGLRVRHGAQAGRTKQRGVWGTARGCRRRHRPKPCGSREARTCGRRRRSRRRPALRCPRCSRSGPPYQCRGDGSEIGEGLVSSPQSLPVRKQTKSFPAAGASRRPSPDRRDNGSHHHSRANTEHRAQTNLRKESSQRIRNDTSPLPLRTIASHTGNMPVDTYLTEHRGVVAPT